MSRETERNAFARAASYLSYKAVARWTAYVAAVASALCLAVLLVLLALFADVVIHRGQLPAFGALPADEQTRVLSDWWSLNDQEQAQQLAPLKLAPDRVTYLVKVNEEDISAADRNLIGELLWKP